MNKWFNFFLILFVIFFVSNIVAVDDFYLYDLMKTDIRTSLGILGYLGVDDSFVDIKTFDPFIENFKWDGDWNNYEFSTENLEIEKEENIFNLPSGLLILGDKGESFCLDNRYLLKRGVFYDENPKLSQPNFFESSAYRLYDCYEYGYCDEGKCVEDFFFRYNYVNYYDVLNEDNEQLLKSLNPFIEDVNLNEKQRYLKYIQTDSDLEKYYNKIKSEDEKKGDFYRYDIKGYPEDDTGKNLFLNGNVYKYNDNTLEFEYVMQDHCLDSYTLVERYYDIQSKSFYSEEIKCDVYNYENKLGGLFITSNTDYCLDGECVDDDYSQKVCEDLGYTWNGDNNGVVNNLVKEIIVDEDNCDDYYTLEEEKGIFDKVTDYETFYLPDLDPFVVSKKLYKNYISGRNGKEIIQSFQLFPIKNYFYDEKSNKYDYPTIPEFTSQHSTHDISEQLLNNNYYYDKDLSVCLDNSNYLLKKVIINDKLYAKLYDCSDYGYCEKGRCVLDLRSRDLLDLDNPSESLLEYIDFSRIDEPILIDTDFDDVLTVYNSIIQEKLSYLQPKSNYVKKGFILNISSSSIITEEYDECENNKLIEYYIEDNKIMNRIVSLEELSGTDSTISRIELISKNNDEFSSILLENYEGKVCWDGELREPDESEDFCEKYNEINSNDLAYWQGAEGFFSHNIEDNTLRIDKKKCVGDDFGENEICDPDSRDDQDNDGYIGCLDEECWQYESECVKYFEDNDYLIVDNLYLIKKILNKDTNEISYLNYIIK